MLPSEDEMPNDKLETALRRNSGQQMLPQFLADASGALGRPVAESELLGLPETEALLRRFEAERRSLAARKSSAALMVDSYLRSVDELKVEVGRLLDRMSDGEIFLYRARSKWCGAIRTSIDEVLHRIQNLVTLDQEDVIACSQTGSPGMFCSWSTEGDGPGGTYHLVAWAEEAESRV